MPEARAWTVHAHSRKLTCPDCHDEGRAEDDQVRRMVLRYGTLLRHRLLAEPPGTMALYGMEHPPCDAEPRTDMACEPLEQYRRMKPQFRHSLLVLRDHSSYLMLYGDAQKAADVLGVGYSGNGPFRIADSMLENVLDRLVRAGHRVAVVMDPHVNDPRNAKQTDLWDALAEDASIVSEPAAPYDRYLFPDRDEVQLCLRERPYGTVVRVQVNWLGTDRHTMRVIHLDLYGGRASSDTGYRSVFRTMSAINRLTEDEVVDMAMDACAAQFAAMNPGADPGQQTLF